MTGLPADAKNLRGVEGFGINQNGNDMFFSLAFDDQSQVTAYCDYLVLGTTIRHLQTGAKEAQRRRLKSNPAAEHREVHETADNPVRQLDIDLDVTGQFAFWKSTLEDGTQTLLQVPLDLMEKLVQELPSGTVEMKRRRAAHQQPH